MLNSLKTTVDEDQEETSKELEQLKQKMEEDEE